MRPGRGRTAPASRSRIILYEHLSAGAAAGDAGLLEAGRAMRDAVAADLRQIGTVELTVAGIDVHARPGETAPAFVAREAAAHDAVWVIAPETGGVLADLQRGVAEVGASSCRWIGCDAAAIRLASSKRATLLHLAAAGIPTPLDFGSAADVVRWVVKPDDGAGAVATRVHASRESALAAADYRAQAGSVCAVEPWVEGEALSLSLLCAATGARLLSVNRQRIEIGGDGVVSFAGVDLDVMNPDDPRQLRLTRLVDLIALGIPGLRGFVGVDLVWQARSGPVVIEINPRVTSAYVGLSAALGRNLAAEIVAASFAPDGSC
ncbi:MAG: ATP-grasp domain-containing protein [Burkholderiales bacterium]|nr:ATP-grasp domain-containing protein [Burkholderiales bacterium]